MVDKICNISWYFDGRYHILTVRAFLRLLLWLIDNTASKPPTHDLWFIGLISGIFLLDIQLPEISNCHRSKVQTTARHTRAVLCLSTNHSSQQGTVVNFCTWPQQRLPNCKPYAVFVKYPFNGTLNAVDQQTYWFIWLEAQRPYILAAST